MVEDDKSPMAVESKEVVSQSTVVEVWWADAPPACVIMGYGVEGPEAVAAGRVLDARAEEFPGRVYQLCSSCDGG